MIKRKLKSYFLKNLTKEEKYNIMIDTVNEADNKELLTELIRYKLTAVNLDTIIFPDDWSEEKQKVFLTDCYTIYRNKTLLWIIERLINAQSRFIVKEAKTIDEVSFSRATINGLQLLKDEIAKWSLEYEKKFEPKDKDFDRTEII